MAVKAKLEAQNPLILRSHRLMEAFAKSDDERDFYLDRYEGFIIYVDLDKPPQDIDILEKELTKNSDRYCPIPKLTFYETKKIMEGFVNEKVYDIDTKEKLLDIIQSKDARTNFLEFIYDHHAELEKWQQYYQERSRIRIIEWLRNNHFHFVFEEDLELSRGLIEKLKQGLFQARVGKDVVTARKMLVAKAKTYYSNEALNPRPKRGRPPKQVAKQEIEPQLTTDIYTTVPIPVKPFLFTPDYASASAVTFSAKFENAEQMLARRSQAYLETDTSVENITQKLAMLRSISNRWGTDEIRGTLNGESDEDDVFDEMDSKKGSGKGVKRTKTIAVEAPKANERRSIIPKAKKAPVKAPAKIVPPKAKPKAKPVSNAKPKPKRIIPVNKTSSTAKKKPTIASKPKAKIISKPKPKAKVISKTKPLPKAKIVSKPKANAAKKPLKTGKPKAKAVVRKR